MHLSSQGRCTFCQNMIRLVVIVSLHTHVSAWQQYSIHSLSAHTFPLCTHILTLHSHSHSVLTFSLCTHIPTAFTFSLRTLIPTMYSHSHSAHTFPLCTHIITALTFPLCTHIPTLHSHSHSVLTFPLCTHILSTSPRCVHHRYVISSPCTESLKLVHNQCNKIVYKIAC